MRQLELIYWPTYHNKLSVQQEKPHPVLNREFPLCPVEHTDSLSESGMD